MFKQILDSDNIQELTSNEIVKITLSRPEYRLIATITDKRKIPVIIEDQKIWDNNIYGAYHIENKEYILFTKEWDF